MHRSEVDEDVDMIPLHHGFREFLPVDSVLLSEREMDSDFAFVEIDIGKRMRPVDCRVESEPELPNHYFPLGFGDERIYLLEHGRKIGRREYSSFLDFYEKWRAVNNFEGVTRIRLYERLSGNGFEVNGLGEYFPDRKRSSFMLACSVVPRIASCPFHRTEGKHMSL